MKFPNTLAASLHYHLCLIYPPNVYSPLWTRPPPSTPKPLPHITAPTHLDPLVNGSLSFLSFFRHCGIGCRSRLFPTCRMVTPNFHNYSVGDLSSPKDVSWKAPTGVSWPRVPALKKTQSFFFHSLRLPVL